MSHGLLIIIQQISCVYGPSISISLWGESGCLWLLILMSLHAAYCNQLSINHLSIALFLTVLNCIKSYLMAADGGTEGHVTNLWNE